MTEVQAAATVLGVLGILNLSATIAAYGLLWGRLSELETEIALLSADDDATPDDSAPELDDPDWWKQ